MIGIQIDDHPCLIKVTIYYYFIYLYFEKQYYTIGLHYIIILCLVINTKTQKIVDNRFNFKMGT